MNYMYTYIYHTVFFYKFQNLPSSNVKCQACRLPPPHDAPDTWPKTGHAKTFKMNALTKTKQDPIQYDPIMIALCHACWFF